MKKIAVTTGSRAEYGLLRPIIKEIHSNKELKLYLIVAGMHLEKRYGLSVKEIEKDGFKTFSKVHMVPQKDSLFHMAKSLGIGIVEFSKIFHRIKPDINLVLGDRDEALASALAASHMNIPNAHIHGGDRTQAGIDEYNRHAITKISNIHFTATLASKKRIIKMGENPKFVHFVGSPGVDEIISSQITSKDELELKFKLKTNDVNLILLQHPVTTETENSKQQILASLKAIVKIGKNTIAIAPNSDAGNDVIFSSLKKYSKKYNFINFYKNLSRSDYLGLLQTCDVLIGNSSSGMIEGSYFDIGVVNIGIRQKYRDHGKNVINVYDETPEKIFKAILKTSKIKKKNNQYLYGTGNTSKKIVKILLSTQINKELIQKHITY